MKPKIVMLVSDGESSRFMYNGLKKEFEIEKVIIEGPIDKWHFLKRRIKRLGLITVIGQITFQLIVVPVLKAFSKSRVAWIVKYMELDDTAFPAEKTTSVDSVNSNDCLNLLEKINPDLVIVNGTRIISKRILKSTDATFINTHVGITPKYRGVHGGYWALVNKDKANCGVTVHLVDTGIDTGGVIYQATIGSTDKDNFTTYTYLQIAEGIKLMKQAIRDFKAGNLKEQLPKTQESKLWYHPTIWFYLITRITKGIK